MAIEYSGGTLRNDLYSGLVSEATILLDIKTTLVAAGWTVDTLHAFCFFQMSGVAANNETVTVGGKVYTFKTVINNSNDGEVFIGADAAACIINFRAALNLGTGAGTLYSTATTANTFATGGIYNAGWVRVDQILVGAPTGVAVSETVANGSWTDSTLGYTGYVATSATTAAGLACKYYFFDALRSQLSIQCVSSDINDTYFSAPTSALGQTLFNSYTNLDMRVMADKYQCFVFVNNCGGADTNAFWCLGVPFIPDNLIGLVVSNVSNGGGLIQVTTSTVHGLTTGELVTMRGTAGVTGANVTNNAITVVDTLNFTLDGSTFSGTYTGGGFVGASSIGQANFKVIEAIWQGGTSSSGNFIRRSLFANGNAFWTLLNGSVQNDTSNTGSLVFATIIYSTSTSVELLWGNGSALITEPFLAFGTSATSIGPIIGQMWNAVIIRKLVTRDTSGPIDSHTYWNLTDNFVGNGVLGCVLYAVA